MEYSIHDILQEAMNEPELTLPLLRKKYIGKTVDLEKIPEYECFYDEKVQELQWEYTYFNKWTGDEFSYEVIVKLSPDNKIRKIGALHCLRYTGADATSAGYRGKRADEFDYCLLDHRLDRLIIEESK